MNRSLILYKYRSFGEYADKIILNSELNFASHTSFNDPFDCNLEHRDFCSYTDEEFESYCQKEGKQGADKEKYLTDLSEELIKAKSEVGILCMSQDYKNILMWSHYSEYHKGLCFGFDSRLFEDIRIRYSQVKYIITPPPNNLKNQQAYLTLGC